MRSPEHPRTRRQNPSARRRRSAARQPWLWAALALLLALGWASPAGRPALGAALAAEIGAQPAAPTPTPAGAGATPRRDMTGPVLALTLLCVLNALGIGVMIGLSMRMRTVAEEALKQKRRRR